MANQIAKISGNLKRDCQTLLSEVRPHIETENKELVFLLTLGHTALKKMTQTGRYDKAAVLEIMALSNENIARN